MQKVAEIQVAIRRSTRGIDDSSLASDLSSFLVKNATSSTYSLNFFFSLSCLELGNVVQKQIETAGTASQTYR